MAQRLVELRVDVGEALLGAALVVADGVDSDAQGALLDAHALLCLLCAGFGVLGDINLLERLLHLDSALLGALLSLHLLLVRLLK